MFERRLWMGIDPGLTGAFATIQNTDKGIETLFLDMPTIAVRKGKGLRNEYNVAAIAEYLEGQRDLGWSLLAAVERQQAMPAALKGQTQGVVSTFRTGMGYGMLLGILAALRIPHELVAPVSWKKALMADSSKDKGASIIVANRLFPQAAPYLKRKKDHARSDALLIAEFCRRRQAS